MKCNIVWTMFLAATLLLSVAAVAEEHSDGVCTNATVAGTWGYTETGSILLPAPTGAIPYASVGRYTLDFNGNLSGARTASAGGTILKATIIGTATVNPDCTGTVTLNFYDLSGNPAGTAVKSIVYLDNSREAHMIITSTSYPAVLTTVAKKQFPNTIWEHVWGR